MPRMNAKLGTVMATFALLYLPALAGSPANETFEQKIEGHLPEDAALGLWSELLKVPTDGFAEKATPVLEKWQALPAGTVAGQCNPLVQAAFKAESPATRMDVPRIYGKLLTDAYLAWQAAGANSEALGKLPDDQRQLAHRGLEPVGRHASALRPAHVASAPNVRTLTPLSPRARA